LLFQYLPHDLALNTDPFSVDNTNKLKTFFACFGEISFENGPGFLGQKRVKIKRIGYFELHWLGERIV
jgi:hypothetical protein